MPKAESGQAKTAKAKPAPAAIAKAPEEAPEPSAKGPWIGAAAESDFRLAGSSEQRVAVWVDVPKAGDREHVPTSVTLTIDTSGSMRGEKIRRAREAAREVVQELSDGDLVSLHTFSDDVKQRVPPTVVSSTTRARLLSFIEELSADGGTNLFDAVRVAEAEAWQSSHRHPLRRVVLISDGRATVGPTSPMELGRLAEIGVSRGVSLTALGVGLDYDEKALNELAMRSSGRLYHLSEPSEMASIIRREIKLLDQTMATEASVELVAAPGVALLGVDNVRASWSARTLRVPLGALFGGQSRELSVRLRVDDEKEGGQPLLSARLHFDDSSEGGAARVQEVLVRVNTTENAALVEKHGNLRAQGIIATQRAAEFAGIASARADSGDFDAAEAQLARAENELRQTADKAKDSSKRKQIVASADRFSQARKSLKAAAKAPPATRARAGRKQALEVNDAYMDLNGF